MGAGRGPGGSRLAPGALREPGPPGRPWSDAPLPWGVLLLSGRVPGGRGGRLGWGPPGAFRAWRAAAGPPGSGASYVRPAPPAPPRSAALGFGPAEVGVGFPAKSPPSPLFSRLSVAVGACLEGVGHLSADPGKQVRGAQWARAGGPRARPGAQRRASLCARPIPGRRCWGEGPRSSGEGARPPGSGGSSAPGTDTAVFGVQKPNELRLPAGPHFHSGTSARTGSVAVCSPAWRAGPAFPRKTSFSGFGKELWGSCELCRKAAGVRLPPRSRRVPGGWSERRVDVPQLFWRPEHGRSPSSGGRASRVLPGRL